jgi:hypothetical protein
MKITIFDRNFKKNLKKLSKKQLIKKVMTEYFLNKNLAHSLQTEEALHDYTRKALDSAERAIVFKDIQIAHKDRLLLALTQS